MRKLYFVSQAFLYGDKQGVIFRFSIITSCPFFEEEDDENDFVRGYIAEALELEAYWGN